MVKSGDIEHTFLPDIEKKINAIYAISEFNELFHDANEILNELRGLFYLIYQEFNRDNKDLNTPKLQSLVSYS